MRFLLYPDLKAKGIPYSSRQLKRAESKGLFPKRRPLFKGGAIRGWPEVVIDRHIARLAEKDECK